ncbi:MAG: tagatose 1,6-diphosphate aldolase [Anaerolineales bacterium]|nr:tagatose 1,6-diphosphate aldolase [Anaerolineales bacterium]
MTPLSLGKLRAIQRIASPRNTITTLALDHRQNLRRALNPSQPDTVTDADLTCFKLEVAAALADHATSILLDPEYAAAQAIAAGIIPKQTGLVVALEATGYTGDPTARHASILPGWGVAQAKRMGADAVKLLVYYHPDGDTAPEIETFVAQVAADCQMHEIPLMLEPLAYSLTDQPLPPAEKRYVVVETARRLTPLGADLLKAEFPSAPEAEWADACTEVSEASVCPWILLSGAVEFEVYLRQVETACRAGASGIAVGRAVWQEAVEMSPPARAAFLHSTARDRLNHLTALCTALAKPWTEFYETREIQTDWYTKN